MTTLITVSVERGDLSCEYLESDERRDLRIYRHYLSELLIMDINILRTSSYSLKILS